MGENVFFFLKFLDNFILNYIQYLIQAVNSKDMHYAFVMEEIPFYKYYMDSV